VFAKSRPVDDGLNAADNYEFTGCIGCMPRPPQIVGESGSRLLSSGAVINRRADIHRAHGLVYRARTISTPITDRQMRLLMEQ